MGEKPFQPSSLRDRSGAGNKDKKKKKQKRGKPPYFVAIENNLIKLLASGY